MKCWWLRWFSCIFHMSFHINLRTKNLSYRIKFSIVIMNIMIIGIVIIINLVEAITINTMKIRITRTLRPISQISITQILITIFRRLDFSWKSHSFIQNHFEENTTDILRLIQGKSYVILPIKSKSLKSRNFRGDFSLWKRIFNSEILLPHLYLPDFSKDSNRFSHCK